MTIFAILTRPDDGPEAISAVPDTFVWPAFLVTPVWALFHRAYGFLGLWFLIAAALYAAHFGIGSGTALMLYGLFALWSGFAAQQIRTMAMERSGWMVHGELTAVDVQSAERAWLERNYGARI